MALEHGKLTLACSESAVTASRSSSTETEIILTPASRPTPAGAKLRGQGSQNRAGSAPSSPASTVKGQIRSSGADGAGEWGGLRSRGNLINWHRVSPAT